MELSNNDSLIRENQAYNDKASMFIAADWYEKLFNHMQQEHDLTLLDTELVDILNIIVPRKYPCKR